MDLEKINKYQNKIDSLSKDVDNFRIKIKKILPELLKVIDKDESRIDHNRRYKLGKEIITIQSQILFKMDFINLYFNNEENEAISRKNHRAKKGEEKIKNIRPEFNFDEKLNMMEYLILKGDKYEAHFAYKEIFNEAKKTKEADITFSVNSILVKANTLARSIPKKAGNIFIKYPKYHPPLKSSKHENWDKLWENILEKHGTLFLD